MKKMNNETFLHRPASIRLLNAAGRFVARLGKPLGGRLDEETLLAAALERTGLVDFGPESFREGLRVLLGSLEREANLSPLGRIIAHGRVLDLLAQRLLLIDWRKRHPELAREEIRNPWFVLGLPRTGTTLLHGLLAQDPAHRSPMTWELVDPVPPAQTAHFDGSRIAAAERMIGKLDALVPGFQAIHPMGARLPQECLAVFAFEFASFEFETTFDVPVTWNGCTATTCGGGLSLPSRSAPAHAERAPRAALGAEDAGASADDRRPARAVSRCADHPDAPRPARGDGVRVEPALLPARGRERRDRSHPRRPAAGPALGRDAAPRHAGTRARHADRAERFCDVQFVDLLEDPIGCVRRIYECFGAPLSAEARRACRASSPRIRARNTARTATASRPSGSIRARRAPLRRVLRTLRDPARAKPGS